MNEVLKERRARIASQMGGEVPAIVARMQAEEDRKLQSAEDQKPDPVAEAQAFIARVKAEKAAKASARSSSWLIDLPDAPEVPSSFVESVPLAERGTLNGKQGFSLLR